MKKFAGSAVVVLLAIFLVMAPVQTAKAAQAGPYYVGIFGGYVIPDDLELSGELDGDLSLDSSWALGAKFGYIFPGAKWFAMELEYTYLADQDVDESGLNGDFSANNLMANFVFRYPDGTIHPYAGFGLGWSWGNAEVSNLPGYGSVDEDADDFAWQLFLGVNFEITPQWSADLSYKYFTCEYGFEGTDAEATNHMILLGINYHF
ncbi:MAG TPA: porin family protein [Syntrophales bacterium]|nr:porin family protein [Syntrophales bacterium]HOX93901.1 porin family protein [Syntrophales bacterium]HPI57990.1 porin family protein [Syntrophales bacterium]HPN25882.1 porin family protein [Syntrophales bacterium]HQM29562.1 porin family protein [Syntrophales bacterium]